MDIATATSSKRDSAMAGNPNLTVLDTEIATLVDMIERCRQEVSRLGGMTFEQLLDNRGLNEAEWSSLINQASARITEIETERAHG